MAAFNMDNGRHATRAPVTRERKPVTGVKVTVTNHDARTPEQRRVELDKEAEELKVSPRFFL